MTLNELVDAVWGHQELKVRPEEGSFGPGVPQAGNRKPLVWVGEFKNDGHGVMTDTRSLAPTTSRTSGELTEFLARQADPVEKPIFQTVVH